MSKQLLPSGEAFEKEKEFFATADDSALESRASELGFVNKKSYVKSMRDHGAALPSQSQVTPPLTDDLDELEIKTLKILKDQPTSVGEISRQVDRSRETVIKVIDSLRAKHYQVKLDEVSRQVVLPHEPTPDFKPTEFKYFHDFYRIGMVTDNHFGSKFQQITLLHDAYKIIDDRDVDFVINAGDLTDGIDMYRGQHQELHKHNAKEQREYTIDNYPRAKKARTYLIGGQHDRSFFKQNGYDIVEHICEKRDDLVYRGFYKADFKVRNAWIHLQHPGGGVSYARSYRMQKIIEGMVGFIIATIAAPLPTLAVFGHWHIPVHLPCYMGVDAVALPCFQCYDDKTEILTRDGWKLFGEVNDDDSVATLNTTTGHFNYETPLERQTFNYDGDLFYLNGKGGYDFAVTPNHKMFASSNWKVNNWHFEEIANFDTCRKYRIKKNAKWHGSKRKSTPLRGFIGGRHSPYTDKIINPETFFKFMGWHISEGSYHWVNNSQCIIDIANFDESNKVEIASLITELGYTPHINHNGVSFSSTLWGKYLRQFGRSGDKYVPTTIKNATPKLIRTFFSTYMKGDGSSRKTVNGLRQWGYATTKSKRLADDLQELALKLQGSASIHTEQQDGVTYYHTSFNWRYNTPLVNKLPERQNYKGKVYCVTTSSGIIYVRRNGKAAWCGNSQTPYLEQKGLMPTVGFAIAELWIDKLGNTSASKIEFFDLSSQIRKNDY